MMAHRKPLGTTCRAHFAMNAWNGTRPDLEDFLVSEAGTAYLVVGIAEGQTRVQYTLERVAEPSPSARVFDFFWLSRDRAA